MPWQNADDPASAADAGQVVALRENQYTYTIMERKM